MWKFSRLLMSLCIVPIAAILVYLYISAPLFDDDTRIHKSWPFRQYRSTQHINNNTPRVRLPLPWNITYIGTSDDTNQVERFLGIPYAQPPVGEYRFANPRPLQPDGVPIVVTATKASVWCPQGTGDVLPFTSRVEEIGEDCLTLGITRSKGVDGMGGSGKGVPVLVWMHGGGHALGSYADQLYNPDGLVRQAAEDGKPIIFVGINYRLGIFGFARSKALVDTGHTNMGLRDQRLAFEWVRDNIAAFGGDPDNIVSIGQSVGASDTGLHMLSYGGERGVPFHKAVMMSGAPGLTFNSDTNQVDQNTASVAERVGCASQEGIQSLKALECMRNIPMMQLNNVSVTAMRTARPPFGEAYFFPVVDNDYIPARPSELLKQGRFVKNIPVIASWVTNDGAWYAPPTTKTDEEVTGSFTLWLSNLSRSTLNKLLELYPIADFELTAGASSYIGGLSPQYYRAAQMNRDLWFTCPVLEFAYHHAQHSTSRTPTYLYEHNATRFLPIFKNIMNVPSWGVSHLSDIPYMLNNDVAAGGDNSANAKDLARRMSRELVNFAYTGNPGGEWPRAFREEAIRKGKLGAEFRMMLWREGDESGSESRSVTVQRQHPKDKVADGISEAVEWERLFERCDFINSPQVRREIGV